jgi:hypothetical protein
MGIRPLNAVPQAMTPAAKGNDELPGFLIGKVDAARYQVMMLKVIAIAASGTEIQFHWRLHELQYTAGR